MSSLNIIEMYLYCVYLFLVCFGFLFLERGLAINLEASNKSCQSLWLVDGPHSLSVYPNFSKFLPGDSIANDC